MGQLLPGGGSITISVGATSAVLYLTSVEYSTEVIQFDRSEFLHEKQKTALETDGTAPVVVQMLYGKPLQILSTGAVTTTARPLTPDDSDLDNIYKKFYIQRYTFTGDASNNSDVGYTYTWAAAHRTLLDRFDAHQKFAGGNISYSELLTLQADSLSYLTSTGLSITGSSIGTLNNMLIRSFKTSVIRDIPAPSAKILNDYTLVADSITIKPLSSLT